MSTLCYACYDINSITQVCPGHQLQTENFLKTTNFITLTYSIYIAIDEVIQNIL